MLIIRSLLDTDFYKFTMGQFVFRHHPNVRVAYVFKNRTADVKLVEVIDEKELRNELDSVRDLDFSKEELNYLASICGASGKKKFSEDYLRFLSLMRLPPYNLRVVDGQFELEFEGPWSTAIYWETPTLSIVNELYYKELLGRMSAMGDDRIDFFRHLKVISEGVVRLNAKIAILKERPHIKIIEFGTRRRFSQQWQKYVVRTLAEKTPGNLVGTSNVYLAMKYGLKPIGTMAHELFMVRAALDSETDVNLRASHNKVLTEWEADYGPDLLIALTDTFGTDFFFRDMTREQAERWQGLRQDSGNPIEFGNRAIAFYTDYGIDPKTKTLVFSDGLDIETIVKLADYFRGRINTLFGWGTNLTNDLGPKPLSLVIKATKVEGRGTVKLSDNLAKAMGTPEDIERYKRVFDYYGNHFEVCKY